ncbi:hypothetical protein D9M71_542690 [compost metagenome]
MLEPLLELAFDPGSCLEQPQVKRTDAYRFQTIRDVPAGNAQSKPLDQGGLSDTWIAYQDGVVLAPTAQYIDHLTNFIVTTEDRIDLPRCRLGGNVMAELVEDR